ncbi:hypothetical protein [Caballeronia sp. LZ001]|uniref:hypothetical protein n=1 Tax=Caballeronia sp. LZ001 TaxID=3038553 RepID=UPI00286752C0|nr:hypothetical protein [Caballeronia sp. LZ001]MDR5802587.1 hypothetical protein [Caballeronia sp. LZ001]
MATYKELRERALADVAVRAEYNRLNSEEYALLDEILATWREAGLSHAEVDERIGTKTPAAA